MGFRDDRKDYFLVIFSFRDGKKWRGEKNFFHERRNNKIPIELVIEQAIFFFIYLFIPVNSIRES